MAGCGQEKEYGMLPKIMEKGQLGKRKVFGVVSSN
jgi:hypothetical protein